jgi:hypothetical protein
MYIGFHVKYPLFWSDVMKIRPLGAELFHADGLSDMTKLIVTFRNFVNAPKNANLTLIPIRHELLILGF